MTKKKALIILVMTVGTFFCMLDTTIMTIVLPEIQTRLNVSLDSLSWAVNLYTIIFATLTILLSRLAEIRGKNKYFIIGLVLFTIGSILSGMSENLSFLLFGRIVQSLGAATILPLTMTISLAQVKVNQRNKIVALLGGAQGFAAALGPTIGGMIAQYYSWRWVFYINVPFLLIIIFLAPFVLPIKNETKLSEKIDILGSILSMIMLFSLTLTLIKGNSWGWSSLIIIILIITTIVSFVLFIITEYKVPDPMINLALFKSRNFNGASLSLILCNFFLGGFAITMPTFLVKTQSKSELQAALLMTPYSISVFIFVILASLLMKKIKIKYLVIYGFIFLSFSYYILGNMKTNIAINSLVIANIFLGLGYGIIAGPANVMAASDFNGKLLTASQSVANVFRQIGLVLATAIFVSLLTINVNHAKDNILSYSSTQISSSSLPNKVKSQALKKIKHTINTSKNSAISTNNLKPKKITISDAQLNSKAQQQVELVLEKKGPLPPIVKKTLYPKLMRIAKRQIKQKVQSTNHQITSLTNTIKDYSKKQLVESFLKIYRTMIPIALISILCGLLFKISKKRTI